MNRSLLTIIPATLLAGLLAACGAMPAAQPAADATPPAPAPNTRAVPTPTPQSNAAPQATAGAAAQPAAGMRTFRIVPEQTEASYEVQEQFLSRDLPSKAIGRTNAVEGEFQFTTDGRPTGQVTYIRVDLRTLTSDDRRRDNRIRQQWLESNTYPYAEFASTGVEGVPESYTEGQEVSFKLLGNLTIREVTRPVTFDVTGKLEGDTVTGTATTQILMKDFGFDPPSIAGMLTVQDGVTIRVQFTAKEVR